MAFKSTKTRVPMTQAQAAAAGTSRPGKVGGRLKIALDLMVRGTPRGEACHEANMAEVSIWEAMRKPHVQAYYRAQLQAILNSEEGRSLATLIEIRDDKQASTAGRLGAIDRLGHSYGNPATSPQSGIPQSAGIVIMVTTPPPSPTEPRQGPVIDVTPTKPRSE